MSSTLMIRLRIASFDSYLNPVNLPSCVDRTAQKTSVAQKKKDKTTGVFARINFHRMNLDDGPTSSKTASTSNSTHIAPSSIPASRTTTLACLKDSYKAQRTAAQASLPNKSRTRNNHEDESVGEDILHPVKPAKHKAKIEIWFEKSRSADSLPKWIKDKYTSRVIPTIINAVGQLPTAFSRSSTQQFKLQTRHAVRAARESVNGVPRRSFLETTAGYVASETFKPSSRTSLTRVTVCYNGVLDVNKPLREASTTNYIKYDTSDFYANESYSMGDVLVDALKLTIAALRRVFGSYQGGKYKNTEKWSRKTTLQREKFWTSVTKSSDGLARKEKYIGRFLGAANVWVVENRQWKGRGSDDGVTSIMM
ncbi:hypothetical protein EIP91_001984 [Steccherinum ochraceum]|uniref:Uncharacterized protein n=1 Tax=Steccherinum ochraceum TaxID=92696 RepID=A0A4R0RTR1_9APHY|nr:hypothetical protein EIP91_001984 [Steccherinum ochraceum]